MADHFVLLPRATATVLPTRSVLLLCLAPSPSHSATACRERLHASCNCVFMISYDQAVASRCQQALTQPAVVIATSVAPHTLAASIHVTRPTACRASNPRQRIAVQLRCDRAGSASAATHVAVAEPAAPGSDTESIASQTSAAPVNGDAPSPSSMPAHMKQHGERPPAAAGPKSAPTAPHPTGVLATINELTKWAVSGLVFCVLAARHDMHAAWCVVGSIASSFVCKLLKHAINEQRPASARKTDPGKWMTSGTAMTNMSAAANCERCDT